MEFHFSLTVRRPNVSTYGCAHILHADANIPAPSSFVNARMRAHTHTHTQKPTYPHCLVSKHEYVLPSFQSLRHWFHFAARADVYELSDL